MKSVYINVQGGLGFNIALTHVLPEIKEKFDKIFVLSPYFDVFESSKYVDCVYKPNEIHSFIFDAKSEDGLIIMNRLYDMDGFIKKELSYSDAWRILLGLPSKKEKGGTSLKANIEPEVKYPYLLKSAESVYQQIGNKKFILCQFWGGQSPLDLPPANENNEPDWSKKPYDYEHEPLKRHYPVELAAQFIKLFKEAHPDVEVIMYSLPNEPSIEGANKFTVPYLTYNVMAKNDNCVGIVSIDSSLPHMTAGIKPAVVIWGHSLPQSFGYSYNNNIIQHCNRDDILYFSALGPSGNRIDYIKPEDLLKSVNETLFH